MELASPIPYTSIRHDDRSGPPKDGRSNLPSPNSTASFWHSEPSEFLLGHRTTYDLPSIADIVIVGSGITGSSIARFLAEDERANGKTIVMLEAREACWGATGRVSLQWSGKCSGNLQGSI